MMKEELKEELLGIFFITISLFFMFLLGVNFGKKIKNKENINNLKVIKTNKEINNTKATTILKK